MVQHKTKLKRTLLIWIMDAIKKHLIFFSFLSHSSEWILGFSTENSAKKRILECSYSLFLKERKPLLVFPSRIVLSPLRLASPPRHVLLPSQSLLWLLSVWTQQGGPAYWCCESQQPLLTGLFYWSYTTATCRAAITVGSSWLSL